jgi:hypothetical protein
VSPVVRAGAFAVDLDHEENSEPGTTTVVCGSHRDDLVASTDGPGGITLTFRLDATSQCRTLAPEHPLVLGARAELDAQRRPSGTLRLLFGAPGSPTLQRTSWSLPMRGDLGAREYAAVRLLTEQNALEGAQAVWVGDAGWYVVFRFGETLYGGWVSPSLQPVGALAPLTAAPVSAGLPTVATNGREVLVVHAARRSNADRWALVAERVTPRGTASPPLSLAIEPPAGQHHFAPSVAALPAGWALGYSQGLLRGSSRRRQHVWLVALDPQLAPRGAPVQVSDDAGGQRRSDRFVRRPRTRGVHGRAGPSALRPRRRRPMPVTPLRPPSASGAVVCARAVFGPRRLRTHRRPLRPTREALPR